MFGYLIAIILPPVPMIQQGRMVSALFTFLLCCTIVGWPLASIWALVATRGSHIEDKRTARLIAAQPTVAPVVPYCQTCGQQLVPGAPACPKCGVALTWG